jgi:DNA-directed RNA polymerase subunit RPC12/RpoP
MSEFKFSCSHCDQHIQCDDRLCGKQIQCPSCHHLIVIPPSPAKLAAGDYSVESGKTWNTFLPLNKAGAPNTVPPAKPPKKP